jgi:hypothetical protein
MWIWPLIHLLYQKNHIKQLHEKNQNMYFINTLFSGMFIIYAIKKSTLLKFEYFLLWWIFIFGIICEVWFFILIFHETYNFKVFYHRIKLHIFHYVIFFHSYFVHFLLSKHNANHSIVLSIKSVHALLRILSEHFMEFDLFWCVLYWLLIEVICLIIFENICCVTISSRRIVMKDLAIYFNLKLK